jgi:hypothetical protein
VSYKSGIATNIVMVSLINSSCGLWHEGQRLLEFTEKFGPRGFAGDICWSDYSAFFTDALPLLTDACNDYVPPG